METLENLDSERLTLGQITCFRIRSEVMVDGETVFSAGTLAFGRVKSISRATANTPEAVTIEAVYATADSGFQVPLRGSFTFEGQFPGESTRVPAGYFMNGYVLSSTSF